MDAASDKLPVHHNLKCNICGESQFEEIEGFYYCRECGTKQEQVRNVEVEQDEYYQNKIKGKKQTIHVAKSEKPQLTSWECYNYILRGLVEDLLSLGAKEELKLMTLQVWAAYLRHMQVAFFNNKQADLPKLGIKYLENDVKAIYNHTRESRKKRKRKNNEDTSCASGDDSMSFAQFHKSKRKLDALNYSQTSATSGASGMTSSTSGNSNRAIKIGFNTKARTYLKKRMPVKHLAKHESDTEGLLKCHKQPTSREISRPEYTLMLVNMRQIYSILGIALNLIGDEIQLSDLIRFIHEGHIGTSNVLQYFPENIAANGKEILKKVNFYKNCDKYSDKALRYNIGLLCKNIGIKAFQQPNVIKLVRRFVKELCLPTFFATYIERLINLLPPQFNTRVVGHYPGFEARAMAYIIFTLKLFYGLDNSKEYRMSSASQKLNSKINLLNSRTLEKQPLLFVWTEWVEYIEMRKIIVSQFNTAFCEQHKQCQSTSQILEQMAEGVRRAEETDNLLDDTSNNLHNKSFRSLFERFQDIIKHNNKEKQSPIRIEFQPSFTPADSYLKIIFLRCKNEVQDANSSNPIEIPDFMHTDHSQRDINSYLEVKPLISYFRRHQLALDVHVLSVAKNKKYVGIFRSPGHRMNYGLQKAFFNVTEDEWSNSIKGSINQNTDDLEFVTELNTYTSYYEKKRRNSKRDIYYNPHLNYNFTTIRANANDVDDRKMANTNLIKEPSTDLQSMYSYKLFSEDNMEPVDSPNFITMPRRNLENIDLFHGVSDEESVINDDDDNISESISLNGQDIAAQELSKEEFASSQFSDPKDKGESSDKCKSNDALKMYISNMDYWMILGSIFMINKSQKAQLQEKFPRSFNWLLETCAQTINVEWETLFEQLLCIETMLGLGIEDPKTIKNYVCINSHNSFKEIQMLLKTYQEIW